MIPRHLRRRKNAQALSCEIIFPALWLGIVANVERPCARGHRVLDAVYKYMSFAHFNRLSGYCHTPLKVILEIQCLYFVAIARKHEHDYVARLRCPDGRCLVVRQRKVQEWDDLRGRWTVFKLIYEEKLS